MKGREALDREAKNQGQFQGEITEEKLLASVQRWKDFTANYEGGLPDGIYDERVTASDYCENVSNVSGILNRICEGMGGPGYRHSPRARRPDRGAGDRFLRPVQAAHKGSHLSGGRRAECPHEQRPSGRRWPFTTRAEMPFTYEPGLTANAIEYVGIYVFLLVLICTFILVPVFASDCQTRADQILRCARDGRGRLAVSRILAGLLLAGVLYVVCMALFLLLLNASFDFRGLDTSLQLLVSVSVFLPLTVGQMELLIGAAGFLLSAGHGRLHPLPVGKNEDSGLSQHRCLRLPHPAHGGVHDPWWKYRELGPLPAALWRRGAHEQLYLRGHGHGALPIWETRPSGSRT